MVFDVTLENRSGSSLTFVRLGTTPGASDVVVEQGTSHTYGSVGGDWLILQEGDTAAHDSGFRALSTVHDLGSRKLPWHGPGPAPSWTNSTWGGTVTPVRLPSGGDRSGTFYFRYEGNGGIRLMVDAENRVSAATTQAGGQILGDGDVPGARIDVNLQSGGYEDGNFAGLRIDGRDLVPPGGFRRGLNVAVVNETTGALEAARVFDTYASGAASAEFVDFVTEVPIGRLVLIAVKDEASRALTEDAKRACEQLGSRHIRNLGYRDSWCLVGQRGAAAGSALETLRARGQGEAAVQTTNMPLMSMLANGVAVIVRSAGWHVGNAARLTVGSQEIQGFPNRRGLNVARINTEGEVTQMRSFDTHGSAQASAEFAQWVEALPRGACVAVACKDECMGNLTDPAKDALRQLGARRAQHIGYRDSYALVGFKGAVEGTVAEQGSSVSACEAHYHLLPEELGGVDTTAAGGQSVGYSVALSSAGFKLGNNARIAIDGTVIGECHRGINIVEIDESTGIAQGHHTFDTHASSTAADAFAAHVEDLPVGQLVALVVKDEAAHQLTERARRAAASLGSRRVWTLAYRNSWLMLGRKGAAPGSVPEQISGDAALGMEMWFTTDGPRTLRPFRDIVVDSAGFEAGNSATIRADGVANDLHGRGFHTAVFDQDTGVMLHAEVFDTYASTRRADALAELIEELPPGRVVALAVQDEASQNLTDRAKRAIASLGAGTSAHSLRYRQSWAFVGRKGASAGMVGSALVTQSHGNVDQFRTAPARASYRLCPKKVFAGKRGFGVALRSSGFLVGNRAEISVNGVETDLPNRRGLNVVVFEAETGRVAATHVFDTHADASASDRFAQLVEGLDRYTMVAIAVRDEATHNLSERARRALRMLGSGLVDRLEYRASWVLCGNVGFAPGGALEVELGAGPVGTSIWVPYGGVSSEHRFQPLFVVFAAFLAVAVLSVAVNLYLSSKIDERKDVRPVPPPPLRPQTPQAPPRRLALLVSARTPSGMQAELPKAADRAVYSHRTRLGNLGLFAESDMTIVSRSEGAEATKATILAELRRLVAGARAGDTLLFAFVGHGVADNREEPARHAVKVWENEARTSAVLLYDTEIADVLAPLHPDVNITCVFHACLSGGLVDDVPSLTARANRGIAITANDRDTPAYLNDGLLPAISEQLRTHEVGVPLPSYQAIFDSAVRYIRNYHNGSNEYPQNPQLVNMTGNDGGHRQNLSSLPYLHKFST